MRTKLAGLNKKSQTRAADRMDSEGVRTACPRADRSKSLDTRTKVCALLLESARGSKAEKIGLLNENLRPKDFPMFSHIVIIWTDPLKPNAVDELLAAAKTYLSAIPGLVSFHIGRMAGSHRPVVDQTYQVALNLQFANKEAQDNYQAHPLHLEFVEKGLKPNFKKVVVYDFE